MKLIGVALCLATVGATALGAQTKTETKIKVKDGKDVSVTGCVTPAASGGFMLTNVADKNGALHSYMLISDDTDFSKHVGQRVQISGKATDQSNAKIVTETKTRTKEQGQDKETHSKSEVNTDSAGVPFLGVKSIKVIAASCS